MPPLHLAKVSLTVMFKLPAAVLERHLPASAEIVGEELARQIIDYVRGEKLGYYPALDFFQSQGGIDPDLLEAAESIAWFATTLVRNEVRSRLRPVFSSVSFQSVQPVAFTMPTVRPSQPNAPINLAEHYTPDKIKATLVVTLFRKSDETEGLDKLAEHMLHRWLKDQFDVVSVTSAQVLP